MEEFLRLEDTVFIPRTSCTTYDLQIDIYMSILSVYVAMTCESKPSLNTELATLTKLPHKISSSHFLNESETSRCCWLIHNFFCLLSFLSVQHTIIEHTNDHNDKLLSNSLSLSASQPLVEYSSRRGRRQRRTNEGWPFTTNVYHFLVTQWTRLPDLRSVAMFGTLIE